MVANFAKINYHFFFISVRSCQYFTTVLQLELEGTTSVLDPKIVEC